MHVLKIFQFIIYFFKLFVCVFDSKAIQLAKDDIKKLQSCFMTCINYPLEFQSRTILDEVVKVLSSVKNNCQINQVLGKYYLKHRVGRYQQLLLLLSFFLLIPGLVGPSPLPLHLSGFPCL